MARFRFYFLSFFEKKTHVIERQILIKRYIFFLKKKEKKMAFKLEGSRS